MILIGLLLLMRDGFSICLVLTLEMSPTVSAFASCWHWRWNLLCQHLPRADTGDATSCFFVYQIHRVLNTSYINYFVYQLLRISNTSYIKYFVYQTLRIWNTSYIKYFVYQILRISNTSLIKYFVINTSYIKYFVYQIFRISNTSYIKLPAVLWELWS